MEIGSSSLYTDYLTSTAATSSKVSSLTSKTSDDYADASDEELMDACKEFESYFLEQIFDTMLESTKLFSDEEEEDSYASRMVDYFKDTAIQTLTEQATEQGTLGLAQTLYEQMKLQYSGISPSELEAQETETDSGEESAEE